MFYEVFCLVVCGQVVDIVSFCFTDRFSFAIDGHIHMYTFLRKIRALQKKLAAGVQFFEDMSERNKQELAI